ncbi:MAG TPA: DUF2461 domain-containing protein [Candidatus Baltobacteraceae bacterium]|nr:DUF2461 domain-containing protein [Candidatus Baltobacteraceae bacterium]
MFAGFPRAGLRFLAELAAHNERAWFEPRKSEYERNVLEPTRAFVSEASDALQRAGVAIGGDARRSIFRIYRDVRFSPDKRPYKTHQSVYLSYDGGRDTPGGLYVHVEPRASYFAVAFYRIERTMLQRWRADMARSPARFLAVLRALGRAGLRIDEPGDRRDALTRMPRGFERYAQSELAPYFKLRSFVVHRPLLQREVTSPALVAQAVAFTRATMPLLEFGWRLD